MDLRQIRYVEAVARRASFTRAAAELHVAQPSLSRAVRILEDELGLQLFDRTSRRVALTDAGEVFVARARKVLVDVDGLGDEMAEYSGAVRGRIRLGFPYHLEPRLPKLLRVFVHENPLVDFSIIEEPGQQMLERLRNGELDVALSIITPDIDLSDLEYVTVREEPLVMVVARSDPLGALSVVSIKEIASRPYICPRLGTATRTWLDHVLAECGVQARIAFETNGLGAMIAFASIGLGATLLTQSLVAAFHDDVATIPISDAPLLRVALAWRAGGYRSPVADSFLQHARRMLAIEGDDRGSAGRPI
jgi:DNA-binding transcriptional LysR family regulator